MTHQPYETWMFEGEQLTNQQKKELYDHLLVCNSCRQLQNNWDYFKNAVTKLPEVSPVSGFTQRWKSEVQRRMVLKQQRQMRLFFGGFISAVVICVALFIIMIFTTQSSIEWVLVSFTNTVSVIVQSGKIIQALFSWAVSIPPVFSITAGVGFFSLFGLFGLAWFYIFIVHVYRKGAILNEKNL